ncbi:MAG: ornithine cyclodeaminase [Alphaproteobacteria bacterium]|nr:ornithine cyclodeaminase [Alphaproteobacteria bacterium]
MAPHLSAATLTTRPDWRSLIDRIEACHRLDKAQIRDIFLGPASQTLLSRAAWIKNLGFGVKSVTVFRDNATRNLPTVQGVMALFDPDTGAPVATLDSDLVTELKTAADSVLGARLLARPHSETLLILGAGTVANSLLEAYPAVFPSLRHVMIWNRTRERAEALADRHRHDGMRISVVDDIGPAIAAADIVSTATMSYEPVIRGDWVRPGTHVDLIGAFKADMREADDALLRKARIFVDSRSTTIGHIGELMIPIAAGVISEADIQGDFYDLAGGAAGRLSDEDITVFKNGGGAHLDLMVACLLHELNM